MNKVKLNIKRLEAYTIDCILIGVISYLISITSKRILTVFNSSFHPTLFIDILKNYMVFKSFAASIEK